MPVDQKQTNHPLDTDTLDENVESIYSDTDKEYIAFVQTRLEVAQRLNDMSHPELNNKTRRQYYDENLKIANTHHLGAKKNADDVTLGSGTIEEKLDSLLSHINNLNIDSEVLTFDKDNNLLHNVGVALTDVIHDTKIREVDSDHAGDEEKRMERQRELLIQGTVFMQENWAKRWEKKKKLTSGKWDGQFSSVTWDERLELVFEGPSKKMLHGLSVYLGNIREFTIENQPFIFIAVSMSYEEARSTYGKWENWKHVKPGKLTEATARESQSIFNNRWRLTDVQKDEVEVIMYQDKWRDEFQIIINGVFMLPMGFPLSEITPGGEYNIVKQVYRQFHHRFAFGKSFVSSGSVKEISALIDEMLKLFVLKTRMSITPPYVNTSGRVISSKVLSPGRISMGFDPQSLQPITANAVQGITAGENAFLSKMEEYLSQSTVSNQFTGQGNRGTQTATETIELQRQSQMTLSLTIGVCMLLEKKLDYLRLMNVLKNWFEPVGTRAVTINDARSIIKKYRTVNRDDANIPGEGIGNRRVIPTGNDLPDMRVVRQLERDEEKKTGVPTRMIFLNANELPKAKLYWYINVKVGEREGSALNKLLFREQLNDVLTMAQLGSMPNVDGLEEDLAKTWNRPRNKMFKSRPVQPQQMADQGGARTPEQQQQAAGRSGVPSIPQGALANPGVSRN